MPRRIKTGRSHWLAYADDHESKSDVPCRIDMSVKTDDEDIFEQIGKDTANATTKIAGAISLPASAAELKSFTASLK
ncbi:hypothetical protein LTR12_006311 [Friedmanniomyces endolithicus]|nr:hypothetical protein LTR74_000814 [Friedmanniomyces endolithicus]KAK1819242.1 hypothetical protein LTR12_006311 [Friedmanniomyces endolithicus]